MYREPRITAGEVCAAVVGPGCGAWEEINNWSVDIPAKTSLDLPGPVVEEKDAQGDRLRQDFKFSSDFSKPHSSHFLFLLQYVVKK